MPWYISPFEMQLSVATLVVLLFALGCDAFHLAASGPKALTAPLDVRDRRIAHQPEFAADALLSLLRVDSENCP